MLRCRSHRPNAQASLGEATSFDPALPLGTASHGTALFDTAPFDTAPFDMPYYETASHHTATGASTSRKGARSETTLSNTRPGIAPTARNAGIVGGAARALLACAFASLLAIPGSTEAQVAATPAQVAASSTRVSNGGDSLRAGRYVVRPGDTLRGLAQRYLGSEGRWREIWELNRELIADPDKLRPGWEIEIQFLWKRLPDDTVVLSQLWNEVQGWRPPLRWTDAQRFDVLRFQDRLQTFADSSAELTFSDSTLLRVTEESMVLLQPASRLGTTVERDTVEILEGQADLAATEVGTGYRGVQLVIGDAMAKPRPSESGKIETRVRKAEGAAQLMVYSGASDLEAGGAEIEVGQGMGSAVKEGQPPSRPEKLLDAPELLAPAPGARLAAPRPPMEWSAVEGAAHYTLELCRDPECSQLQRRIPALEKNTWQSETKLPVATLYWRVTATSASGLDGYPSDARELVILTHDEDTTPPEVRFEVAPPRLAPRFGLESFWILGPGATFEAVAEDGQSGIDRWIPLLDGEEIDVEEWQAGPWPTGEHLEASFVAIDRASNEARLEPIAFVYDDQAPTLEWGLEGLGPYGDVSTPGTPVGSLGESASLRRHEVNDPHSPWPWRKQKWQVERDSSQLVIRPNRPVRVRVEGQVLELTPENGLWILAEDAICSSIYRFEYDFDLRLEGRWPKKQSRIVLRVRAVDWVTNSIEGELTIETAGRGKGQAGPVAGAQ